MVYNNGNIVHELRSTPGYTNYVVGVNKNLNGEVSSAQLKRYYSNIDAEIYINGEWIEDINSIQWDIQQRTIPLYGFNSYTFDDIARGTRIISGRFTINFTEPRFIENAIAKNSPETKSIDYGNSKVADYEDVEELGMNATDASSVSKIIENKSDAPIFPSTDKTSSVNRTKRGCFDIDIVCGGQTQMANNPLHIILKNCVITSVSSMRSQDGDVAREMYQFYAQDFVTV